MRRSSSGPASLVARRLPRVLTVATTTRRLSPSGWPARARQFDKPNASLDEPPRQQTLRHLDAEQKIEHLYLTALSRLPTEDETAQALAFIRQQARHLGLPDDEASDDPRPWAAYCHVMLNLKEFIYLI